MLIRSHNIHSPEKGRYIDQIGIFYREDGRNEITLFVQDGKVKEWELPDSIRNTMERAGIKEPFGQGVINS